MIDKKRKKLDYYKEYMSKRYYERRKMAFDIVGRVCAMCQQTFTDSELELDHIDPKTKELDFAKKWNVTLEVFLAEVRKAQPLCKPCHAQKSIVDAGKKKAEHGTFAMYRHYKCRCDLCKIANNEVSKKYKAVARAKKKAEKLLKNNS